MPRSTSRAPCPLPLTPSSADLLFELGTEELPAAYLPDLIAQLAQDAQQQLAAAHLEFVSARAFGTPRRLVLHVRGLAGMQHNPPEEVRGPSKQAAFDANGKPTPALQGFLRSRNTTEKQIKLVASDKGEYVYIVKPATAVPIASVLAQLLPKLVAGLRAPKSMRWDATGTRFARPIRWAVAFYGSAPLRVSIGRVAAGNKTWVGAPLRPQAAAVASIPAYFQLLKKAGVILDQDERRQTIEQAITVVAQKHGGRVAPELIEHGLLDEVTFLVERPVAVAGRFNDKFLQLPQPVLLASMAKHQRVFAIEAGGRLVPEFVAVLETSPGQLARVRKTIERILEARLQDSELFSKEDHERLPLDKMGEALSGVVFHPQLGTMAEKTVRLRGLAEPLAEAWRLSEEEKNHLRRACQLAKADLVSTMVKEFPTLQGIVGKHYALDSQEPAAVAEAIEEQYLPTGARLPKTLIGSALALVDKYDTLTGYFGLGIEPTGDQDPFGLRRAAQGIVEIAWKIHRPLPLETLLRQRGSMPPFRAMEPKQIAQVGHRVQRYLLERLYTFSWPEPATEPGAPRSARGGDGSAGAGVRHRPPSNDSIDAVIASTNDDLVDVMDRILSLRQLAGDPGLLRAAKVIERTRNILKGSSLRQPEVDPNRLTEPDERKLWDLYQAHHTEITRLTKARDYGAATTKFGDVFFEPVHDFFKNVLVNVPEDGLKQNRLALMKVINALYTERIADLSKLSILQQQQQENP